jgi:hypothetical protein
MTEQNEEAVRARAHRIWEEEGRPEGCERLHWERAVREVQALKDGQKPTVFSEELILQPAPIVPS